MKKLNQNSKEAGVNARVFKNEHHELIVKSLGGLWANTSHEYRKQGFTPYDIAMWSRYFKKGGLDVSAIFRRLSEMVRLGLIEVTPTIGKTPHGRKCSCYRLKSKKK